MANGKKLNALSSININTCAGEVLQSLHNSKPIPTDKYAQGLLVRAYELLKYERLIRRNHDIAAFEITKYGQEHISKHGYVVYP